MGDSIVAQSLTERKIATKLSAKVMGVPAWAQGPAFANNKVRQVNLGLAFLGELNCGELQVATAKDVKPAVPDAACGSLGRDFMSLFDWDLNFVKQTAEVATAPKNCLDPLPFDLDADMRMLRLAPVKLPAQCLACVMEIQQLDGDRSDDLVSITCLIDFRAPLTVCNRACVKRLGIKARRRADHSSQTFQAKMLIGEDPDRPRWVKAPITFGVDRQIDLFKGIDEDWPTLILGLDVLCRSRLVFSERLRGIWMPSES